MDFYREDDIIKSFGYTKDQYFKMNYDRQQLLFLKYIMIQSKLNQTEEKENNKKKILGIFKRK